MYTICIECSSKWSQLVPHKVTTFSPHLSFSSSSVYIGLSLSSSSHRQFVACTSRSLCSGGGDPVHLVACVQVEEILRTKLAANWKAVSKSIVKYDKHGSGLLKTGQLRRLIEQICLPLSTEHYQRYAPSHSLTSITMTNMIGYYVFVCTLGVV